MSTDPSQYVASIPEGHRPHVEAVRRLVRRVAPLAVERVEEGMIRFAYGSRAFAAVSSQGGTLGLYLIDFGGRPELRKKYEAGLAGVDMGPGFIRFQEVDELPIDVIADILREATAPRAKPIGKPAAKAKSKGKAKKKAAAKPARRPAKKSAAARKPAKKASAKKKTKKARAK